MSEHDRSMLACYAHPDDEQGVSGTLAKAAHYGHRVGILMSTRGEVGEIADPSLATPETLGAVREQEMRCAAAALAIRDENVFFLGYRDSGMEGTAENQDPRAAVNAPDHEAIGQIVQVIRTFRPDVILTFDAYGGYGHPDHRAVHRWTTAAFHAAGQVNEYPEAGRPFQPARLYYASFPRSMIMRMAEFMRQAGVTPDTTAFARMDPSQMGMAEEDITNWVDTQDYLEVKARSLACHATQLAPNSPFAKMPPDVLRTLRSREAFQLAAGVPFPPAGDPSDLFAGLD